MSPSEENFVAVLPRFTAAGLTGLADHAEDVSKLGELLAAGLLTPESLRAFVLKHAPLVGGDGTDPQTYWAGLWGKLLGRPVEVPPVPVLKAKTNAALREYKFKLMFIPNITEDECPAFFQKPKWGQYLTEANIKRRELPGRWVAVETIAKPHYNAADGYGHGDADPFARALGLETRFSQSWDKIQDVHLKNAAKLLGTSEKSTRLPSAEEWNLIGNLFNWLRKEQNEALPDLGSTNSWEWCENAFGSEGRLLAGDAEYGGLAGVDGYWHGNGDVCIAFRVLVVL